MIRPIGGKRRSDSPGWFACIVCDASSLLDQAFRRFLQDNNRSKLQHSFELLLTPEHPRLSEMTIYAKTLQYGGIRQNTLTQV
jgi:hypothetical protein